MSDKIVPAQSGQLMIRYVDMGDGTFAPTFYNVGSGGGGGGGGAVTIADGANVTQGAKADAPASWYNTTGSLMAKLSLMIAAAVGAGSHVFTLNANGQILTDTWTLLTVSRVKTWTYDPVTGGPLTESDWV